VNRDRWLGLLAIILAALLIALLVVPFIYFAVQLAPDL
jgi:hypothetical protein